MSGKARQKISDYFSMNAEQAAASVTKNFPVQNLLRWLTREDPDGETPLSRLFDEYSENHLQGGLHPIFDMPGKGEPQVAHLLLVIFGVAK